MKEIQKIRNFSIIAHIDHGKSTLADRFIQLCGALQEREMEEQVLDTMDIERERGITIKAQSVALDYIDPAGEQYRFNLIDTPGHVDFSYEVSRSLAACEGALLVVDATQGVEAQSVANCYTAVEYGLEIVPVINKIDLEGAEPDRVLTEIEEIIGISCAEACMISARTGAGVKELLAHIPRLISPPSGSAHDVLRALIIDSWFDRYLGVITLVRIMDGVLTRGTRLLAKSTHCEFLAERIGIFTPHRCYSEQLNAGEVGFVVAGVKNIHGVPVGDTLVSAAALDTPSLPGFRNVEPRVYAGLYPVADTNFESFREALQRLSLNDASLHYEAEHSDALGPGFRCGFLGLLHMEIIQERLEREYDLDILITAPTVVYEVLTRSNQVLRLSNPSALPRTEEITELREPIIHASILTPRKFLGNIIELCMRCRGTQREMRFVGNQVALEFELPLSEIVADFFDRLKSLSRGYASLDYQMAGFVPAPLVRLDILINGDKVDSLAVIVHRSHAEERGRLIASRMKDVIPRQMFEVAIQAAVGGRIVARENVRAIRKNVTAKCYGGDVTRKRKLLEKQKAGKKRMRKFGRIDVPQEAFMTLLRTEK